MNKLMYKAGIGIIAALLIVGALFYYLRKTDNSEELASNKETLTKESSQTQTNENKQTGVEQNSTNQDTANNQNNNEKNDSKNQISQSGNLVMAAKDFPTESTNYYLDGEYLAIDPDSNTDSGTEMAFPGESGTYNIILHTIGEDDGRSSYKVYVSGKLIGQHQNQLAKQSRENFSVTFEKVSVNKGDIIRVESNVHSEDGNDYSRGRWEKIEFVKIQ